MADFNWDQFRRGADTAGGALPGPAPAPESSYIASPGPPAGVDPKKFREEMSSKTADDLVNQRTKAEGALDFLKISPRTKDVYAAGSDVFGPWMGTEEAQKYLRAPMAAVGSDTAQKNMEAYNQVQAATKELASLGLKARYGARITNVDVAQNNAMFGGLTAASSKSATEALHRMELEHGDALNNAVDLGLIDPRKVVSSLPPDVLEHHLTSGVLDPNRFLPKVGSPAQAQGLPPGSFFVRPDGKVMKVPLR